MSSIPIPSERSRNQSFTSRITSKVKASAKSFISHFPFHPHSTASLPPVERLFKYIASHSTSPATAPASSELVIRQSDIIEWINDEVFMENPYFSLQSHHVRTPEELAAKFMQQWDKNHNDVVTQQEFMDSLKRKSTNEIEQMGMTVFSVNENRLRNAYRKVYDALDPDSKGWVDFGTICTWLSYDAVYRASISNDSPDVTEDEKHHVWTILDADTDGMVKFDDICRYLSTWTIREIRVRTSQMRFDSENNKLKQTAELLAESMAQRLGLSNSGISSDSQLSFPSGVRQRSLSDIRTAGPVSRIHSRSADNLKAYNRPKKSHIQRQIDELVLRSLALASEASEINSERRKLNRETEKIDRALRTIEKQHPNVDQEIENRLRNELKETEVLHEQLNIRHQQISSQLTNLNSQISILFDGQLYERRYSLGDRSTDKEIILPVPVVASVQCAMDSKKTNGLLNVSNYFLMYESLLGAHSRYTHPVSHRFCVDVGDIQSIRLLHPDDEGENEEGDLDQSLSELESALKEPSLATLSIELKSGYINKFVDEEVRSPYTSAPTSLYPSPSTTPRSTTVVCSGDYQSLFRIEKSLQLFISLSESSKRFQQQRRRAHSVCVSRPADGEAVESPPHHHARDSRTSLRLGASSPVDGLLISGVSEITANENLQKIFSAIPLHLQPQLWRLAYSTTQHGASFPFFFLSTSNANSSVILIQTTNKDIIGGFAGDNWQNRRNSENCDYYGSQYSFVFELNPISRDLSPYLTSALASTNELPVLKDRSELKPPSLEHADTDPEAISGVLATPEHSAASVVLDTMAKATLAVETATASGLPVTNAVRRASIDNTNAYTSISPTSVSLYRIAESLGAAYTLVVHRASSENHNYMYSSADMLAMGGDNDTPAENAAWAIDRDFKNGRSSICSTYASPILTSTPTWTCERMEVWIPVSDSNYSSHLSISLSAVKPVTRDDTNVGARGNRNLGTRASLPNLCISITPA